MEDLQEGFDDDGDDDDDDDDALPVVVAGEFLRWLYSQIIQ